MSDPIDGGKLLAIRARVARAGYGLHQSLSVTEADRDALLREVYRLRALVPAAPDWADAPIVTAETEGPE